MTVLETTEGESLPARRTCAGKRKDGSPCASTLVQDDGYCVQHSPTKRFDPRETGRVGGLKAGEQRRALSNSYRARMVQQFESDTRTYRKIVAAFQDALEAFTSCPGCGEQMPDHGRRVDAARSALAELYGKPVQPTREEGGLTLVVRPISRPGGPSPLE
jgi:hypothetical protein